MTLQAKDVLVIDDDEAIRRVLASALARLGVTCDTASDGADALQQVMGTFYSVILVDLMMPRVDGEAFVSALRERDKASAQRPVVLLMTAFPVRERVPNMGDKVQAVIQKPFDVLEIAELVHDCVEGRRAYDARKSAIPSASDLAPVAEERPAVRIQEN